MAKAKKKRRRLYKVRINEVSLVDSPAVGASRFLVAKRDEDGTMADETLEAAVGEMIEKAEDVGEAKEVVVAVEGDKEAKGKSDAGDVTKAAAKPEAEGEPVEIQKAADAWLKAIKILRSTAADMDPPGLEMLANVIRYTGYRYGDDETVRMALTKMDIEVGEFDEVADDVEKAMKVIGPTAFGKIETAAGAIVTQAQTIQGLAKSAREIKKTEGGEAEAAEEITKQAKESTAEHAAESGGETAGAPNKDRTPQQRPKQDLLAAAGAILKQREAKAEGDLEAKLAAGLEKIAARLDKVEQGQSRFAEGLSLAQGKV